MYSAKITKDRIRTICKIKKINAKIMLLECELGANAIQQINDSKGMASFSIAKIADYLDCSVDYLLGRTDIPEINKGNIINITDATPHKLVAFGGMQNEEVEPPIEEKTT